MYYPGTETVPVSPALDSKTTGRVGLTMAAIAYFGILWHTVAYYGIL